MCCKSAVKRNIVLQCFQMKLTKVLVQKIWKRERFGQILIAHCYMSRANMKNPLTPFQIFFVYNEKNNVTIWLNNLTEHSCWYQIIFRHTFSKHVSFCLTAVGTVKTRERSHFRLCHFLQFCLFGCIFLRAIFFAKCRRKIEISHFQLLIAYLT